MTDFTGQSVGVFGIGRSGLGAAEVLSQIGAKVVIYDTKPEGEIQNAIIAAQQCGARVVAGVQDKIDYSEIDCLITSPGVPVSSPVLQGAVAAGIPVYSEIEAAYRIAKAPILAVTGTNGKTTTTVLLGEILCASGINAYIAGNVAAGTIAMPLIKAAHMANADEIIAAEISSFQLEWIDQFRPRAAALLNITPDHGDRQSWDEYVTAKWRIFENQTEDDLAVMNDDLAKDERASKVRAQIECFGPLEADAIVGSVIDPDKVCLPGVHNQHNLAAAILMTRRWGATDDAIRKVASGFTGVVHRLEFVKEINGIRFINNSMCTNVDAFEKSMEAIPQPKVVIAGGVFKGGDLTPVAQAVVENNVKSVVLIGTSAADIENALLSKSYTSIYKAASLNDAVEHAYKSASPGDIVILAPACASFDMFKDFEDRGDRFKEAVNVLGLS